MKVSVSYSKNKNSQKAGMQTAQDVVEKIGQPDLVILFTTDRFKQNEVITGVKEVMKGTKLIGCCAAGIITNEGVFTDAIGLMGIKSKKLKVTTALEEHISKDPQQAGRFAGKKLLKDGKNGTVIVLPDGFASNISDIVRGLYQVMGSDYEFVGGGAGDNLKFFKTYQFTEKKVTSDALAVALLSGITTNSSVGHGWESIGDSLIITKSDGKTVSEINNKPAFKAYTNCFKGITPENFASYGMKHPLGLPDVNGNYIIRDPLKVNKDGSIDCVTEVSQNSIANIMKGDNKDLIKSAEKVAQDAMKEIKNPKFTLIFDCISRYLVLGKDFQKELNAIQKAIGKDVPLLGVLTFGEIGSHKGEAPLFHNKTLVINVGK